MGNYTNAKAIHQKRNGTPKWKNGTNLRMVVQQIREDYDPDEDAKNGGHQGLAQADYIDSVTNSKFSELEDKVADEEIAKEFEVLPVGRQLSEEEVPESIKGTYDDPRIRWLVVGQRMAVAPKHKRTSLIDLFKKLTDLHLPLRDYESMNLYELRNLYSETARAVSKEIIERCSPDEVASLRSYIHTVSNIR